MKKLTDCLINKNTSCFPIWFMRQAGRYLPEFRKIRSNNSDFIKLCLNSDLSSEITLQPINRFNIDAAIIFSDILMVPYGCGQNVNFEKGKGPILSEFKTDRFLNCEELEFTKKLSPIYQAINITRKKLNKEKNLISFIGSPWTLIVYMFGLKKGKNILKINTFKKKQSEIEQILKKLIKFLCIHIKNQIDAGAEIVQIFDSWAGLIPTDFLHKYCYEPNQILVKFCKDNKIPVICFPKGLNNNYIDFFKIVKPDGLNIDYDLKPEWVRKNFEGVCIQGGMHPEILLQNDRRILEEAEKYLKIFKDTPYIFNLGHGLLPETDPEKLNKLINFVKGYK